MARRLPRYGVDCLTLSPFVYWVSQDRQLTKRGIKSSPRYFYDGIKTTKTEIT